MAVANELHFGRAASKLHMGTPSLSEMVRRLEKELGTPLLSRTTRRVTLTKAGSELLLRSKVILEDVAAAKAAVRGVAEGDAGTLKLGMTPPASSTLVPHLVDRLAAEAPRANVEVQRMWLPRLSDALTSGEIDVAVTCGVPPKRSGVATEVFAAEELLVGLRHSHRLAGRSGVSLSDLAGDVLGIPTDSLFPAWAMSIRRALETAGISPFTVELASTDLGGGGWTRHEGIDWILTIPSLVSERTESEMAIVPVRPRHSVPFSLQWRPDLARTTVVARFVHLTLAGDLPPGWQPEVDHLGYGEPGSSGGDGGTGRFS